ncbi:SurA N-terminal domain-containing protein [Luminiphilus sp.]|nr:SurA N-terminal domain-containing protein [Luminiphilus sp.]MDA9721790.1 SurA N-terminal domain-containing protein [Luminiphilus sp.]
MLQSMRQSTQSTAAKVIIGLIVMSFAAFGLETLLPGGSGTSVAEVNGEEITPFALQEAITQQKRQLANVLGDDIDLALLDDDRLQPRALQSLIQRALLLQKSAALNLVASEAQVGKSITAIESFQLNGQFSPDAYKSVLANAGYTPERFRRAQAEDIVLTQLQTAISETEFATQTELAATANLIAEERDVRYLVIPEEELVTDEDLSDAALRDYYQLNEAAFFNPEQVTVDYILLDPADFVVSVDELVVVEQYEAVKDEYEVAEQARVSHILLIQGDDEPDATYGQRIAETAERIGRGEDFADLAAELSDDLGSASLGGELGFTDGSAFPDEMETAIAALAEPGDISGAVETDAGTHFIRLEERIAGDSVDYASVREELRASIEAAEAERNLLIAVEELRDLAFNAPDLSGPAAAIGAEVQVSEPFSLGEADGLFADTRLREIAFSDDVKVSGNNSEVLELSGQRFVAVRVRDVRAPQIAPFEEVKGEVRRGLSAKLQTAALTNMTERAETLLASGESMEAAAKMLGVEWRVELAATRLTSQLPQPVLETAFAMPQGQTDALRTVPVPGEGYALVQLARVNPGDVAALSGAEAQQLSDLRSGEQQRLSFEEFLVHQRNAADIVIR